MKDKTGKLDSDGTGKYQHYREALNGYAPKIYTSIVDKATYQRIIKSGWRKPTTEATFIEERDSGRWEIMEVRKWENDNYLVRERIIDPIDAFIFDTSIIMRYFHESEFASTDDDNVSAFIGFLIEGLQESGIKVFFDELDKLIQADEQRCSVAENQWSKFKMR